MKLTVLKIQKHRSKYGDRFYYVFLKGDNGGSFKSCVSPSYGNWLRCNWNRVIEIGRGCVLRYPNLPINSHGLLDADIAFEILGREEVASNEKTVISG